MSKAVARKGVPARRRGLVRRNTMAFPRALRDAIPELHDGRELELDSVLAQPMHHPWLGTMVELRCVVKETGKLSGEFVVRMGLQVEAARGLAETLARVADEAELGG